MIKRTLAGLAPFAVAMLLAPSAWGSYLQDQPRKSGKCGEYAVSNMVNWKEGLNTTGEQIFQAWKFRWYHTSTGASYHTGKRDLMKAIAQPYGLHVKKFTRARSSLRRGFRIARRALHEGGAIIMLARGGLLTGRGHFVMGYLYMNHGDKIAVSDSNPLNPDTWYSVSWLLNSSEGHIIKLWVYT